ncbi:DDE Tnp 1 7 domain containing protein, partial [Asbolus verrucosus]
NNLLPAAMFRLFFDEEFWQNRNNTNNKLLCDAISRDRFQYIMSNLQFTDNTKLNKVDIYSKLRPLFDILNKKFFEYVLAEENHSIDESMIPYFGRQNGKQFIRRKPIRWGYKFWIGALRMNYIVYFDPY